MSKANAVSEHIPSVPANPELRPESVPDKVNPDPKKYVLKKIPNKEEYRVVDRQILRWRARRKKAERKERDAELKRKEALKAKRRIWNIFSPEEE